MFKFIFIKMFRQFIELSYKKYYLSEYSKKIALEK